METIDSLIYARWVVPVEPAGVVFEHHAIAVHRGHIIALLPSADASSRYEARQQFALPEHALLPGLVNLHTHAGMTLMRGLADDLPLMTWLNEHIWPRERQHAGHEFVRDGTLLGCAEMLKSGVTTFNEMYFYPEASAQAVLQAGMRAALGVIVIEFASSYAHSADDYLHRGLATRDEFKGEVLLSFTIAPHAPYTVSDTTLARVAALSEQLDCPVHMHVHETADEIAMSLKVHGTRPLARLDRFGLVGNHLIAVHATQLADDEIDKLAAQGCHVAHCPSSNLKLASGLAPVARLSERGINVGIGTDGAASNNRLDMLGEMRLAALLAKGVAGRAEALPAERALAMATIDAARALGLDDRIGTIAPGKAADLTAIRLDGDTRTMPCFDVVSHLVYVAGREQVTHVWVNGEARVVDGELAGLAEEEIFARARFWQAKLSS